MCCMILLEMKLSQQILRDSPGKAPFPNTPWPSPTSLRFHRLRSVLKKYLNAVLDRYENSRCHPITRHVDWRAATCHVKIKVKFPRAARVTGSRRICLARAAFELSLLGLPWPVNIGCNSRSVEDAAAPEAFPGSMSAARTRPAMQHGA